jgi:hypothetical protein
MRSIGLFLWTRKCAFGFHKTHNCLTSWATVGCSRMILLHGVGRSGISLSVKWLAISRSTLVRFRVRADMYFSSCQSPVQWYRRRFSRGYRLPAGSDAGHSTPYIPEVKNAQSLTSTWCLVIRRTLPVSLFEGRISLCTLLADHFLF